MPSTRYRVLWFALAFALCFVVLSSSASAASASLALHCPYSLTRTPFMFNATLVNEAGTYVCDSANLYANVVTPSGVTVQYQPQSCNAGVHAFNVTFTETGSYQLTAFNTVYSGVTDNNCTIAYYAPTKRTVPDSNPALILAVGVLSAFLIANRSPSNRKKR